MSALDLFAFGAFKNGSELTLDSGIFAGNIVAGNLNYLAAALWKPDFTVLKHEKVLCNGVPVGKFLELYVTAVDVIRPGCSNQEWSSFG
jgi:hypothetical protein